MCTSFKLAKFVVSVILHGAFNMRGFFAAENTKGYSEGLRKVRVSTHKKAYSDSV